MESQSKQISNNAFFLSMLKLRLNNCIDFVSESVTHNIESLDKIDDELSHKFYKNVCAIDFALEYGLISTYSIFDYFFLNYCKKVEKISQLKLKNFKGKNDNVKRAKFIYASTTTDIQNFSEFKSIEEYRIIRNLLIHNNLNIKAGKSSQQTDDYQGIIARNSYLELDNQSGKVFINSLNYIIEFRNNIILLFEKLIQIISVHNKV